MTLSAPADLPAIIPEGGKSREWRLRDLGIMRKLRSFEWVMTAFLSPKVFVTAFGLAFWVVCLSSNINLTAETTQQNGHLGKIDEASSFDLSGLVPLKRGDGDILHHRRKRFEQFKFLLPKMALAGGLSDVGDGNTFGNMTIIKGNVALEASLPLFLLDHSGFAVSGTDPLISNEQTDLSFIPIFPLLKAKKGLFSSDSLEGVIVPKEFFGKTASNNETNKNSGINVRTRPSNNLEISAVNRLKNLGYGAVFVNDNLLGTKKGGTLISNTTSYGIEFSPDFGINKKMMSIETKQGYSLNLASRVNKVGNSVRELFVTKESRQETVSQMLELAPYIHEYIVRSDASNAKSLAVKPDGNLVVAIRNGDFKLPKSEVPLNLRNDVGDNCVDKTLKTIRREVKDPNLIKKELEMKESIKRFTNSVPVLNDVSANRLIQDVCDYLAQAYQVPKDLWPKCRIQASMVPNAFALPGGDVFVSAGMLGVISDLDGLMLVLGHEIGHVLARHGTKQNASMNVAIKTLNGVSIFGNLLSLAASGGTFGGSVDLALLFPKYVISSQLSGFAESLIGATYAAGLMAYSRDHEMEADSLGQQAAFASGAQETGLKESSKSFSRWLQNYTKPMTLKEKIFASHPSNEKREVAIGKRSDKLKNLEGFCATGDKSNRLGQEIYEKYSNLHKQWQPYSEEFGKYLKTQIEQANAKGKTSYLEALQYHPGSQCVSYALQ